MELPSKLLEQKAFNTRPKIEDMLIVMNRSKHEKHLSQPLQTNNKQFKNAVTFLTVYNGIFNVTNSNIKLYFRESPIDEDFFHVTIPHSAYEIESLNNEIKRIILAKVYYSEKDYPFTIKPNFTTLGSNIEISPQGPINGFIINNNIGNLLGFHETKLWQDYNISPNLVDILSFDKIFFDCDIAKGMLFKVKRSDIIHHFTKDVDPGSNYIETFAGGITWYMMETKDLISGIFLKFKNERGNLVSFNGQSISFRLSIEEIWIST